MIADLLNTVFGEVLVKAPVYGRRETSKPGISERADIVHGIFFIMSIRNKILMRFFLDEASVHRD